MSADEKMDWFLSDSWQDEIFKKEIYPRFIRVIRGLFLSLSFSFAPFRVIRGYLGSGCNDFSVPS